jgi:hypothetical protein
MEQGLVGDTCLRGEVVLVGSRHGAVDHDQARLLRPGVLNEPRHVDVLALEPHEPIIRSVHALAYLLVGQGPHPAAVEPEDVDRSVVRHQLVDLPVGVLHEPLPAIRVPLDVVVGIAIRRREVGPPVVRAVPVRLREVSADPEAPLPEGLKDRGGDVGLRVCVERGRRCRDAVVRQPSVKHAEAVVMLGGEDDILHAGVMRGPGPALRIERGRVERGLEILVCLLVLEVIVHRPRAPRLVLGA